MFKNMRSMNDDPNDWLSKEKKREGYREGKTSAEIIHEKEETSRDWNAGAVSNADEHRAQHAEIHQEVQDSKETIDNPEAWKRVKLEAALVFINFVVAILTAIMPSNGMISESSLWPFQFLIFSTFGGMLVCLGIFKRPPWWWYSIGCLLIALYSYFSNFLVMYY